VNNPNKNTGKRARQSRRRHINPIVDAAPTERTAKRRAAGFALVSGAAALAMTVGGYKTGHGSSGPAEGVGALFGAGAAVRYYTDMNNWRLHESAGRRRYKPNILKKIGVLAASAAIGSGAVGIATHIGDNVPQPTEAAQVQQVQVSHDPAVSLSSEYSQTVVTLPATHGPVPEASTAQNNNVPPPPDTQPPAA
jgi:hypothetical protein